MISHGVEISIAGGGADEKDESRWDQNAACIGCKMRKNGPDVRKGEIWIVRSGRERPEHKDSGREVVRSMKP